MGKPLTPGCRSHEEKLIAKSESKGTFIQGTRPIQHSSDSQTSKAKQIQLLLFHFRLCHNPEIISTSIFYTHVSEDSRGKLNEEITAFIFLIISSLIFLIFRLTVAYFQCPKNYKGVNVRQRSNDKYDVKSSRTLIFQRSLSSLKGHAPINH